MSKIPVPLAFPHHLFTVRQLNSIADPFFFSQTLNHSVPTCCSDDIIDYFPGDWLITEKPDRPPLIQELIECLWPFNHFSLRVALASEGDMGNIFLKSLPLFLTLCKKIQVVRDFFAGGCCRYPWHSHCNTPCPALAYTALLHHW